MVSQKNRNSRQTGKLPYSIRPFFQSGSTVNESGTRIKLGWAQSSVFQSTARDILLVAGRRWGKSYFSIARAIKTAIDAPGVRSDWAKRFGPPVVHYFYPTYRQAQSVIWETLKRLTEPFWERKPNNSDLIIYVIGGGQIHLKGVDVDPDKLRGPGIDLAIYDECAFYKSLKAVRDVVDPMLSERQGSSLFITSPNAFNEIYDFWNSIPGLIEAGEDIARFQFTSIQGGHIPEEEIERARRLKDPRTFRQEYLASFESMAEGVIYYAFSDANISRAPLKFNPHVPIIWSLDFNVDPLCSVIMQKIDGLGGLEWTRSNPEYPLPESKIYVIDEIFMRHANTYQLLDLFAKKTQPYLKQLTRPLEVWFYGDASMSHDHTSSRFSDYTIIKQWFQGQDKYKLIDRVPSSNPEVANRVAAVNGYLMNADGFRRLVVNKDCINLIKDFRQVTWADGTGTREDQKTDKMLTHISSAAGYYLHEISPYVAEGGYESGTPV